MLYEVRLAANTFGFDIAELLQYAGVRAKLRETECERSTQRGGGGGIKYVEPLERVWYKLCRRGGGGRVLH